MGVSGPASCTPSTIYSAIGYAVIGKVFKSGYQRYTMRMAVPLMKIARMSGLVLYAGLGYSQGLARALPLLIYWSLHGRVMAGGPGENHVMVAPE